jgi:hypothetical protein
MFLSELSQVTARSIGHLRHNPARLPIFQNQGAPELFGSVFVIRGGLGLKCFRIVQKQ